jgi:hypothetical protein
VRRRAPNCCWSFALMSAALSVSLMACDDASARRAKEIDDMNRRHDEAEREAAVRAIANRDAADAARVAAEQQADAEAQANVAELRGLSPSERVTRAKQVCFAADKCPNAAVESILAASASDDERARIAAAIRPIAKQKEKEAATARPARESSVEDPQRHLCPFAARRAIAKMDACGLNMDGIDEASLCRRLTYDKLSFLGSRSCSEVSSILFGE